MFRRSRITSSFVATLALCGPLVTSGAAHADVNECAPITIGGQVAACLTVSAAQSLQPNGDPQLDLNITLSVYGEQPQTLSESEVVPIAEVGGDLPSFCAATGQHVYRAGSTSYDVGRVYGIGQVVPPIGTQGYCSGFLSVTIVPSGSDQTASVTAPSVTTTPTYPVTEPYDVPEICLTTQPGACVGPYAGTISPEIEQPSATAPSVNQGDPTQLCLGIPETYQAFLISSSPAIPGTDIMGSYDGHNCLPYVPVGLPAPDLT